MSFKFFWVYNYACALYQTKQQIKFLKGEYLCLLLKNKNEKLSAVFGRRYFRKKGRIMILYMDANNLFGWDIIQALAHGRNEHVIKISDEVLATADDNEFGYFEDLDGLLMDLE